MNPEVLQAAWQKHLPTVLARARQLLGPWPGTEERRQAERAAHQLVGSAGSFGYPRISELARQAEVLLRGQEPLDGGRVAELGRAILAELEGGRAEGVSPPAVSPAGSARVVAVDDDPALLEAVRLALEGGGLAVATESDPLQAQARMVEFNPDLILLDVDMPGLNGVELARRLRAQPRWDAVPIIFLSASQDGDLVSRLFAAGADDYLPKPCPPAQLLARVRSRLERFQRLREGRRGPTHDVLLVEDDPVLADLVSTSLTAVGLRVLWEPQSSAALERLRAAEVRPRVLLLDESLGDPRELAAQALRVILLSERESAPGAWDCLAKPFRLEVLVARVQRALS